MVAWSMALPHLALHGLLRLLHLVNLGHRLLRVPHGCRVSHGNRDAQQVQGAEGDPDPMEPKKPKMRKTPALTSAV